MTRQINKLSNLNVSATVTHTSNETILLMRHLRLCSVKNWSQFGLYQQWQGALWINLSIWNAMRSWQANETLLYVHALLYSASLPKRKTNLIDVFVKRIVFFFKCYYCLFHRKYWLIPLQVNILIFILITVLYVCIKFSFIFFYQLFYIWVQLLLERMRKLRNEPTMV